jgi:hypothetical protein
MSDESQLDPTFISVRCPKCSVKLRVRGTLAGKTGTCPKCQAELSIPRLPEYGSEWDDDEGPAVRDDSGREYRLATPLGHEPDDGAPAPLPRDFHAPVPEHGFLDQLGKVRQIEISKPPRFTFFSGVFEFPWHDEVWPRWVWMALGGLVTSIIPVVAIWILESAAGYSMITLAFFAMPQIWLSIWTGSYAAACGMQVFEDTAAGNDRISGWPDPNWREWMIPFVHQCYVAFMAFALAYGIGKALGFSGRDLFLEIVLAELILFPFGWLSVLEGNNILLLSSPKVLWTVITKPLPWLTFYILVGLLAAAWCGALWAACRVNALLGMSLNGFLFATGVLIYFRLLGRLAWAISHNQHQRRRKSKKATSKVRAL